MCVLNVEGADLMRARATAGTEFEATVREVVQHGRALGIADRVVGARAQVEDPRADVDVFGLGGKKAQIDVVGGNMTVFGQAMMFGDPAILPVVFRPPRGRRPLHREWPHVRPLNRVPFLPGHSPEQKFPNSIFLS